MMLVINDLKKFGKNIIQNENLSKYSYGLILVVQQNYSLDQKTKNN